MSVLLCPLCDKMKDEDYVGCFTLAIPARGEDNLLICGDCFEHLPDHIPEEEREGVLLDGEVVDWGEWE